MRLSRSQFKYALCFVKKHENTLRRESLAHKLAQCKPADFWKEIRSMNMNKTTLPSSIAGTTGGTNIAELWRQHFSQLFNCIDDDVNGAILDHVFSSDMVVTSEEVDSAINMLVNNKSCGADGLFAENMKHGGKRLNTLLAMCFTGLFVHGFLPDSMLSVVLVPIIKDKNGKIGNTDNYRPIALATVVSKTVETIILHRMSAFLDTNYNQFGFKRKLGTDMCILWRAVFTFNPYLLISRIRFIDIKNSFIDIKNSFIDIKNAFIDIKNSFIDIKNSFIDIKNSFIDIKNSFIDIKNAFIDIKNSFIDIKNSFIDINKDGCQRHLY